MNASQPVLFLAHGSPEFALEPGPAGAAQSALTARLRRPRAIVVVSPHWATDVPTVGTATRLETMHDFRGFDRRLYDIQYPAIGSPPVAEAVVQALREAGLPVATDPQRGLDHGAWTPLRQMFPQAEVPIVPLSLQPAGGPGLAHRVGRALAPLTRRDVLVIGSGNITHNLRDWHQARQGGGVDPGYAQGFADWVHEQLLHGSLDALLSYRQTRPDGVRAHPSEEHLLPLFTALGAAGPDSVATAFHRGFNDPMIAMDSYAFAPRGGAGATAPG